MFLKLLDGRLSFSVIVMSWLLALITACESASDRDALQYFAAMAPRMLDRDVPTTVPTIDCEREPDVYESLLGEEIPIQLSSAPLATVGFSEIVEARIYEEIPTPLLSGSHHSFRVELEVTEDARQRIDRDRLLSCGNALIIQKGDRKLGLAPIPNWGVHAPLPGGLFPTADDAAEFYRAIGGKLTRVPLSDEARRYWETRNAKGMELMAWYAKCDPGKLESLMTDPIDEVLASPELQKRMESVDCGADAPEIHFSPAP